MRENECQSRNPLPDETTFSVRGGIRAQGAAGNQRGGRCQDRPCAPLSNHFTARALPHPHCAPRYLN